MEEGKKEMCERRKYNIQPSSKGLNSLVEKGINDEKNNKNLELEEEEKRNNFGLQINFSNSSHPLSSFFFKENNIGPVVALFSITSDICNK